MQRKSFISLSLACLLACSTAAGQAIPPFRSGERVALVGDSITHGGHYHSYIWLYYMTRFPEMPVYLFNRGVGGDAAEGVLDRWRQDVLSCAPTYITLTFGMNDTGYFDVFNKENSEELAGLKIRESLKEFSGITQMIEKDSPDAEIVMIGGSPYDETSKFNNQVLKGKNEAICKIIDAQKETASDHGWGFVDFNAPMRVIAERMQESDSAYSFCPQDRIHPDKDGQMVMAYLFLKAQGLAGKKVSGMDINARRKTVKEQENCSLSNLNGGEDGISFDYLAKALPYPCDSISEHGWGNIHSQRDALKLIPFTKEFNQETLRVTGLGEGDYLLSIDGQPIDSVSSSRLAGGVNLAEYTYTPQYRQASEIMYLNEERLDVEKRFREYVWMEFNMFKGTDQLWADDWKSIEMVDKRAANDWFVASSNYWYRKSYYKDIREVWQNYMDELVERIYKINKPVVRKITITKL